ncbi:MAG: serine/threonine-protein kinase [Proteobacteria bacterium]|nr:serine/threonine-protein kinase [Pseudomonadota bacterium]
MTKRDEATVNARPKSGPSSPATDAGAEAEAGVPAGAFDPPAVPSARFTEHGELGRGGMGRVADARDEVLGRDVAIKHMLSTEAVDLARFEREARITARLEHPSIVPLYDAGRNADGSPFYVMRKVDGRPLDQLVDDGAAGETLVPNMLAVCDAVAFAHARGIIHRDIKPTNILVGAYGETLLIDWGLARELDAVPDAGSSFGSMPAAAGAGGIPPSDGDLGTLTRVGTVAGTPGFMAPEQARGEHLARQVDVFALGATMFYILSRQPPFASFDSGTEMLAQVAANRTPRWERLPKQTPADLRAILVKAMAPRVEDRYADAGALAADLRRFVTGNLVGAHRYGRLEQLRRFGRRHRAAVVVAGAGLAIVGIVALLAIRRVIVERDGATTARDAERTARAFAEQRQQEAVDNADTQLIARAALQAEDDPVAAITTLRTLRAGSPRWPAAATVLEGARLHGIPFGFANDQQIYRVAIAPDRPRAFSIDIANHLAIYDLVAHTRAAWRDVGRPIQSVWLDGKIALVEQAQVRLFDDRGDVVETVPTPSTLDAAWGDDHGTLWVRGKSDATVFQLDGGPAARTWRPIMAHVDEVEPDLTLERAIVRRGGVVSVWTPTQEYPLLADHRGSFVTTFGHAWVALTVGGGIEQWRFDGTAYTRAERWEAKYLMMLGTLGDAPVAFADRRLFQLNRRGGMLPLRFAPEMLFTTGRGAIVTTESGEIRLFDAAGDTTIGRGARRYRSVAWSEDGRFVVAATDGNDVVAWDLTTFRPRTHLLASNRVVLAVEPTAIWSRAEDEVLRRDLATDVETRELESMAVSAIAISPDQRWRVALDMGATHVFDRERRKDFSFSPGPLHVQPAGVLVAEGAVIRRFSATEPDGAVVGTLPFVPGLVVAADAEIVGLDHDIARYQTTTKALTVIPTDRRLDQAALSAGHVLYVIADGELLLVRGSQLVPITTSRPCTSMRWVGDVLIAKCANALFEVQDTRARPIASDVRAWSASGTLVSYETPRNQVVVLDRATGVHTTLDASLAYNTPLLVTADRVVFESAERTGGRHAIVEYSWRPVSTEAELRARLARVTNVGAVTWPER